ncbi:MAG: hypothetical protein AB1540_01170 [Bdellovibrionota bacterium]
MKRQSFLRRVLRLFSVGFLVATASTVCFSSLSLAEENRTLGDGAEKRVQKSGLAVLEEYKANIDRKILEEITAKTQARANFEKERHAAEQAAMDHAIKTFLNSNSTEAERLRAVEALVPLSAKFLSEHADSLELMRGGYASVNPVVQSIFFRLQEVSKKKMADPHEYRDASKVLASQDKYDLKESLEELFPIREWTCWKGEDLSAIQADFDRQIADEKESIEEKKRKIASIEQSPEFLRAKQLKVIEEKVNEIFDCATSIGSQDGCERAIAKLVEGFPYDDFDLDYNEMRIVDPGYAKDRLREPVFTAAQNVHDQLKSKKVRLPDEIQSLKELMGKKFGLLFNERVSDKNPKDHRYALTSFGQDYLSFLVFGYGPFDPKPRSVQVHRIPEIVAEVEKLKQLDKKNFPDGVPRLPLNLRYHPISAVENLQFFKKYGREDQLKEKKQKVTECFADRAVVDEKIRQPKNVGKDLPSAGDVAAWRTDLIKVVKKYRGDLDDPKALKPNELW